MHVHAACMHVHAAIKIISAEKCTTSEPTGASPQKINFGSEEELHVQSAV